VRGGRWERDLAADLDVIEAWGAVAVVTLIEQHEFQMLGVVALGEQVRSRGIAWYHLPIVDVQAPGARFEAAWLTAGAELTDLLGKGGRLLVHCRGGLGRAGMVAARLLVELGVPAREAVARVRAARPGAIETAAQLEYVLKLTP
jgi:ADP-ribosyl-[dinitrogen reductase] hydrolase